MASKKDYTLFDVFDELSANSILEDNSSAEDVLRDFDIDIEQEKTLGYKKLKSIAFLAKATANKQKDESLLNLAEARLKQLIARNAEFATDLLRNVLGENSASFQFRKLEKWSDEEMREVLNDLDLAKLLEELDNENDL